MVQGPIMYLSGFDDPLYPFVSNRYHIPSVAWIGQGSLKKKKRNIEECIRANTDEKDAKTPCDFARGHFYPRC